MTQTPENEELSALSSLLSSAGLTAKDFMQTLSVLGNAKKESIEKEKKNATEGKIFLNKEFIILQELMCISTKIIARRTKTIT